MLPIDSFQKYGFTAKDYTEIFKLDELEKKDLHILDCYSGFNSFAAEMSQLQQHVVCLDPLYGNSLEELKAIFASQRSILARSLAASGISTTEIDEVLKAKAAEISPFWDDYALGRDQDRYLDASFPALPFKSEAFDLVLCTNYLFSDGALTEDTRLAAFLELARVADEIRVFPLQKNGHPVAALGPILQDLQNKNYDVEIKKVTLNGSCQPMLIIDSTCCDIAAHRKAL